MKRLIQLNLLLLLISSATAQDSQPQEPSPQQTPKTLRVYDWNDLARQHELSGGEVISMDGMSVLKIENTNNAELDTNNPPFEVSLLKVSDPSVIKKVYFVLCEVKYDNVRDNVLTTPFDQSGFGGGGRGRGGFGNFTRQVSGNLTLLSHTPPAALGGDRRTIVKGGTPGGRSGVIRGSSNWRPCLFTVKRDSFEGLPTQLEVKLTLPGRGTVYLRPIKLLGVTGSWWSPQQIGLIGGIGGSVIGCFGALLGWLAGKGKARNFVLTTIKIFIALGILLTIAGFVAVVSNQPYAVWYALLLPGVILTLVFSLNLPSIQRRYDDLEIRRMTSLDTMGS